MRVNFQIGSSDELKLSGRSIDLHNNFDFLGFEYRTDDMSAILRWRKTDGEWVRPDELQSVTIEHRSVSFMKVTERDPDLPPTEDGCLSSVTYYPSSDREGNDGICERVLPEDHDDIVYTFQSGQTIRIGCKEIKLSTE